MRRVNGVSLVEICVAVGILAFCFLPIMNFSQANVRETQVSQEDLIARHFLIGGDWGAFRLASTMCVQKLVAF